jgi:hypothetical protein
MKQLASVALALLLVPGLLQAAGTRRTWMISTFSWIRRVPAEKGAPASGQPMRVEAAALAQALGAVRFVSGSAEEPLFDPAEAADVAKAMAEALALAGPDEDLELLSTAKRGRFALGDSLGVTARIFARDDKLNLIVHDARKDYMVEYRQETRMPEFDYGSRSVAGGVTLKAPGAEVRRADWIVLPLAAPAPVASPQSVAGSRPIAQASIPGSTPGAPACACVCACGGKCCGQ